MLLKIYGAYMYFYFAPALHSFILRTLMAYMFLPARKRNIRLFVRIAFFNAGTLDLIFLISRDWTNISLRAHTSFFICVRSDR